MTATVHTSGQQFPRAAGVVVPLFSLRGGQDVGSGEIFDLVPFINWLARWHQRVVQLLPINETAPDEASPYNTLSAFAIDPGYISAALADDFARSPAGLEWLRSPATQERIRRARRAPRRRRRAAYALQLRLLGFGFEAFTRAASVERVERFAEFGRQQAWWLDDYALFRSIKEERQWTSWETWPPALRDRDAAALAQAAARLQRRRRFFQYVQWVAADQWAAVRAHARRRGVLLKGDLPFVCGRDSADVWAHRELFDLSSSAGAPPDTFSPTGQAWGLPLYDRRAMRRSSYDWWRRRLRQARALYDMVRVDHVVGLYRTYAIPVRAGGTAGFVPSDEHEQLTQGSELMRAILEEAGSNCGVIAEDLGTVPQWVRESLTELHIPGYKVLRWETHDGDYIGPRSYPALSVATTGTHDTETLAEWWDTLSSEQRATLLRSLDVTDSGLSTPHSGLLPLLRRLYDAGSALTILPIQDLFGGRERINTPATIDRRNWVYRLPVAINDLDAQPEIRARMEAIRAMVDASGR